MTPSTEMSSNGAAPNQEPIENPVQESPGAEVGMPTGEKDVLEPVESSDTPAGTESSPVTASTEQPQDGIIEGGWEYVVPVYALSWIVLVAYSWSVLTKFKRGS